MKYGLVLFFLALLTCPLYAQYDTAAYETEESESEAADDYGYEESIQQMPPPRDPAKLTTTRNYANEKITVRKFDNDKWKKVIGDTDYNENPDKKSNRERDREEGKDRSKSESSTAPSIPISGPFLKIIFYAIVVAIILWILYLIAKNTSFKSSPKVAKPNASAEETVEDIADLDIDTLLANAGGNYRLAIRLYFLGLLKKLNAGGYIVWQKDKTNRDYLSELYAKATYFNEVRQLTLAYERIWYGDHSIPADVYQQLKDEFKAVDQQLNQAYTP